MEPILQEQTRWIWRKSAEKEIDTYQRFRKEFDWDARQGKCFLQLSADSSFAVYINGKRVPGGQFSDYPEQRTYSTLEVTPYLQNGRNAIGIEVHYIGVKLHVYLPGKPSLRAALYTGAGLVCSSDRSWKCSAGAFRNQAQRQMTFQAGFTFEYDAEKENCWSKTDFDDSAWETAFEYSEAEWHPVLEARPVPQLLETGFSDALLLNCGQLIRPENLDDIPGLRCQEDFLKADFPENVFEFGDPPKADYYNLHLSPENDDFWEFKPFEPKDPVNGLYVTIDLGRESVGFLCLRLKACAGTVIEIAHGEHLDSGRVRVRNSTGRYSFADRYICADGLNEFLYPHRRLGCRYLELHITHITGSVALNYAGLRELMLPLPERAKFECEDRELMRLNELGIRTMQLCMHEHYEDCPWREQALWVLDSRLQMFIGYHVWGNYDFVASSLELMRRSCTDGFLTLTCPGDPNRTIPSFSLAYINALRERLLFGGEWAQLKTHLATVDLILDNALSHKNGDFYELDISNPRYWHFFEWRHELSNLVHYPQLPWNVFLYEALRSAAELHLFAGNKERAQMLQNTAEKLGTAVEKFFREGAVYSILEPGKTKKFYEFAQIVMLLNGLVPEERKAGLWEVLKSGKLLPVTSSSMMFLMNALMECTPESRACCDKRMVSEYRPMLDQGATSLWETREGSHDMGGSGSLCHAWSANPTAYIGRYLLGIRPLEPGFKRFAVRVYPGHLTHAAGEVPTPHGRIAVSWKLNSEKKLEIEVKAPAGTSAVHEEYPEFPVFRWL